MTACQTCGHDPGDTAAFGPLLVRSDPWEAFWRGVRMEGLPQAHCRILHLLASAGGKASHLALQINCIGENACPKVIAVQICLLRRKLPAGLRIVTLRGWGYRLEVAP